MTRIRRWAERLHGGQLLMAIVGLLTVSFACFVAGVFTGESASSAKATLERGEYQENATEIGGQFYVLQNNTAASDSGSVSAFYVQYLRHLADSLRSAGRDGYAIRTELERHPGVTHTYAEPRAYYESRAALWRQGAGLFGLVVALATALLAVALPWWWFGGRTAK